MVMRYWPGGSGHWSASPEYPLYVSVIDDTGFGDYFTENLNVAAKWWNACEAGVILKPTTSRFAEPWSVGTITATRNTDMGPYGGWDPTKRHGYISFARGDGDKGTIAHELGHALGFGHAGSRRSIMGQWDIWRRRGVGRNDKRGLRNYYGRR